MVSERGPESPRVDAAGDAAPSPEPPSVAPRHLGLAFAAAPLAVFVLSQVVFELTGGGLVPAGGSPGTSATPATPDPASTGDAAHALGARLLWAASTLVFYVAAAAAVIGSLSLLVRHLACGLRVRYALAWLVLTGGALAHLSLSGAARNAYSAIYFFTYERLAGCACLAPGAVATYARMEIAVNVLAGAAPMLLLLATCAVLEPDALDGRAALHGVQRRMRRLKRLLNLASALLVAGMLNMTLWLRWPAALPADAPAGATTSAITDAVTFYWGTVFTLVVVSLYIPASMELNRRAEALLARDPDAKGSARDTAEWLERHGLSLTPTQQLPQVMAMLAPMLAGSVGSGIASVPGALGAG